jgi:signal transduction histidine kinase
LSASLGRAILGVGATSAAFAAVEFACMDWGRGVQAVAADALQIGCGLVFTVTGLAAWWRRPSNNLGLLMVCCGWSFFLTTLYVVPATAALVTAIVLQSLPLPMVGHIVLAFPSGRLSDPLPRALALYAYADALIVTIPYYLYSDTHTFLTLRVDPARAQFWQHVSSGVSVLAVAVFCVIIVQRLRAASPSKRRVLLPLYIYAMVGLGAALVVAAHPYGPTPDRLGRELVLFSWLALVPVSFALALARGGFARTAAVEELGGWLATEPASRTQLAKRLAATLGDRSAELLFWSDERREFVDGRGASVEPVPVNGRAVEPITIDDRLVGAIGYDTNLIADGGDVRAAGRVMALAVDRDRLIADLHASEEELRRSRTRIAEAGQHERRRLARRLHDELQNRIVVLAVGLQMAAGDDRFSAELRDQLERLRHDADDLATLLRAIAYDVMPAPLIERGLRAALEDLCDRVPVSTTLQYEVAGQERLPEAVETLTYFVAAEALTNALKHAQPGALSIAVELDGTDRVRLTVQDDGVGGASPRGGHGLADLTDRVRALGGDLTIHSPAGEGTTVRAVLPL